MRKSLAKIAIIVLLSWSLIYLFYISRLPNIVKIGLSIATLYIAGKWVEKRVKLEKELIFYLWKSQKGKQLLFKLAKNTRFWEYLSDLYFFLAFGVLGVFFTKWRKPKERILLFIASLIISYSLLLIYPFVMVILSSMLSLPIEIKESVLSLAMPFLGLALSMLIAILYKAFETGISLLGVLLNNASPPESSLVILLPGINLPFLEGIIALSALLIVHEFSHGILAIVERIKIKSLGIVSFGTLPIGAFVEVDEKRLSRTGRRSLARIVVSGTGSNFIFSIISFALLLAFLYFTAPFSQPSCLLVKDGLLIHTEYVKGCNKALLEEKTGLKLEGFEIKELSGKGLLRKYKSSLLNFIYTTLALTTALNLIVGLINLLPVPFFDGYLLYKRFFPGYITKLLSIAAIASFLILILPGLLK